MIRLILPVLLAVMAGCAKPPAATFPWTPPSAGSFLSDAGLPMSDAVIVARARSADFILVGESHTNLCDHAVQARLIEALARSGRRFSIGLEMLPVTAQPVLDRFNAGSLMAETLGDEVGWEKLWGYPYAQYKPVFELAERYGLPVAALNVPRQTLTTVRDKGEAGLSQADREALPRRIIPASPAQRAALAEQVGMHQTMREAGAPKDGDGKTPDMAETFSFAGDESVLDPPSADARMVWCSSTCISRAFLWAGLAGMIRRGRTSLSAWVSPSLPLSRKVTSACLGMFRPATGRSNCSASSKMGLYRA